jgi:hypothetical protein
MLSLVLASLIAASGSAPTVSMDVKRKATDPNKIVCQMRAPVGSRLATIRECHTAQEWDEMRRSERLGLMRKQMNGDHGCNYNEGGTPCAISNGGRDTPW